MSPDQNVVSFYAETSIGGVRVTLCACGVLCFSPMAHLHADACPVYLAAVEADASGPSVVEGDPEQ